MGLECSGVRRCRGDRRLRSAAAMEALRRHVEFLSSDACEGRAQGTRGGTAARRYLTDELESPAIHPAVVDG